MQNDRALARRIGKGERSADEEFLPLFGARVQRLVRRSIASDADAEDITQEIFIDLFRCAATFRGEASLSTWVLGVAYNHCRRPPV